MRRLLAVFLLLAATAAGIAVPALPQKVQTARILILSANLAEEGIGEWGFAALVEADGQRILFDTGARPETVLKNARDLGLSLSDIREVVLSHSDDDHTGGLLALRRELARVNASALSRAHVARGFFYEREEDPGRNERIAALKSEYEGGGGVFVEHVKPVALLPGVWMLGPIPRVHPERNWSSDGKIRTPEGPVEDTIPEDTSLVLDTDRGLVVLSGCCHAGIINTLDYARKAIRPAPIYAAVGGFHLMRASDQSLDWTAKILRKFGLANFIGAHCTGIEPVYRIRQKAGLSRKTCIVGAVGSQFALDKGITAGLLTH